jgi:hypothetical protein
MTRPGGSFLSSATPVICRPALPKDTGAVLEFTRHIWEGEDYIPEVWSEWLADHQGLLATAEYSGSVAGLCKLSQLDLDQ